MQPWAPQAWARPHHTGMVVRTKFKPIQKSTSRGLPSCIDHCACVWCSVRCYRCTDALLCTTLHSLTYFPIHLLVHRLFCCTVTQSYRAACVTWLNRKEGKTSARKKKMKKWIKLWSYTCNHFQVKTNHFFSLKKKNLCFYCNFCSKSSAYLKHMKHTNSSHHFISSTTWPRTTDTRHLYNSSQMSSAI